MTSPELFVLLHKQTSDHLSLRKLDILRTYNSIDEVNPMASAAQRAVWAKMKACAMKCKRTSNYRACMKPCLRGR